MNPKTILTEDAWEDAAPDCKGKDKEFVKALGAYGGLEEDEFDDRSKALTKISALANTLKGSNEVKGDKDAVKYLTDVISAAKAKQGELMKAQADAKKEAQEAAKKQAAAEAAKKKADDAEKKEADEAKEKEKDDEDEDEAGDSTAKLVSALKTLKTARNPYYFLVCDSKPYGLVLSKKDIRKNAEARKELSQLAGGSTRPPRVGEVHWDGGKYVLEMDKPPSGLARILQKWVKDSTGLTVKIMVGDQSSDDDDSDGGDDAAA